MLRVFQRQDGFSLIEIIIACAIAAIIAFGFTSLMTNVFTFQKRVSTKDALRDISITLRDGIAIQSSWTATLASAANALGTLGVVNVGCTTQAECFSCLNGNGCLNNAFSVYINGITNSGGALNFGFSNAWNPNIAGRGFNVDQGGRMTPCAANNFVPTNNFPGGAAAIGTGVDACPFSVFLRVDGNCNGVTPACPNPSLTVATTFDYNPSSAGLQRFGSLNIDEFNFTQVPGTGTVNSPVTNCTMLNGIYNAATNTCIFKNDNADAAAPPNCPAGTFLMRDVDAAVTDPVLAGVQVGGRNVYRCVPRFQSFGAAAIPACGANQAHALNGTTAVCNSFARAPSPTNCASGNSVVTSIAANGDVNCSPIALPGAGSCGAGLVMTGINSNGSPICDYPNQNVVWSGVNSANMSGGDVNLTVNCPAGYIAIGCHCTCDSGRMRHCGPWDADTTACRVNCRWNGNPDDSYVAIRAKCIRG